MNENAGHCNYLTPNRVPFIFPFTPLTNTNLYFIAPSNPIVFSSPDLKRTDNFLVEEDSEAEEILPDFRCKVCSVSVPTFPEFEAHLSTHDAKTIVVCSESPETKTSANQIPEEGTRQKRPSILQPLMRGGDFRCPYCPRTFRLRPRLSEHVLEHRITSDVSCVMCRTTFSDITSLRMHLLMFHCKDKNRRQCPYCSYRCFQTSDLDKHIARRHTRDFRFKCSLCVKGFATPKELKNHEFRKHSKSMGSRQ